MSYSSLNVSVKLGDFSRQYDNFTAFSFLCNGQRKQSKCTKEREKCLRGLTFSYTTKSIQVELHFYGLTSRKVRVCYKVCNAPLCTAPALVSLQDGRKWFPFRLRSYGGYGVARKISSGILMG